MADGRVLLRSAALSRQVISGTSSSTCGAALAIDSLSFDASFPMGPGPEASASGASPRRLRLGWGTSRQHRRQVRSNEAAPSSTLIEGRRLSLTAKPCVTRGASAHMSPELGGKGLPDARRPRVGLHTKYYY